MNGMWQKTCRRVDCDFKGLSKDEEFSKINKAVAEEANNLSVGVSGDDIEKLLKEVPVELTNKELLELKQEGLTEKETAGEEKEEPPVKIMVKGFSDFNKLLKKFKNMDPPNNKRFSLIERNVHGELSTYNL